MENPCIKCKMSQSEKAACCGCADRLEYEKIRKIDSISVAGVDECGET